MGSQCPDPVALNTIEHIDSGTFILEKEIIAFLSNSLKLNAH